MMKIIPESSTEKNLSETANIIQILHLLFDGYLPPSIGSELDRAMKYFDRSLHSFIRDTRITDPKIVSISELFSDSYKCYMNISNVMKPPHNLLSVPINEDYVEIGEYISDHSLNESYDTNKIIKVKKISGNLDARANVVMDELITYYKTYVKKNIVDKYNSLILPSGWRSITGGHLVGLLYQIKKNNIYNLFLFNSGYGIQYHKINPINSSQLSVIDAYTVHKEHLIRILIDCLMFDFVISLDQEKDSDNYSFFYKRLVKQRLKKYEIDIYHINDDSIFVNPQLSGSCTFYGFYYLIRYLFYEQNDVQSFKMYDKYIREQGITFLINYLSKSGRITNSDYNLLTLIQQIKDEDNLRYNRDTVQELNKIYIDSVANYSLLQMDYSNMTDYYTSIIFKPISYLWVPGFEPERNIGDNLTELFRFLYGLEHYKLYGTHKVNVEDKNIKIERTSQLVIYTYMLNFLIKLLDVEISENFNEYNTLNMLINLGWFSAITFDKHKHMCIMIVSQLLFIKINEALPTNRKFFQEALEINNMPLKVKYNMLSTINNVIMHTFPIKNQTRKLQKYIGLISGTPGSNAGYPMDFSHFEYYINYDKNKTIEEDFFAKGRTYYVIYIMSNLDIYRIIAHGYSIDRNFDPNQLSIDDFFMLENKKVRFTQNLNTYSKVEDNFRLIDQKNSLNRIYKFYLDTYDNIFNIINLIESNQINGLTNICDKYRDVDHDTILFPAIIYQNLLDGGDIPIDKINMVPIGTLLEDDQFPSYSFNKEKLKLALSSEIINKLFANIPEHILIKVIYQIVYYLYDMDVDRKSSILHGLEKYVNDKTEYYLCWLMVHDILVEYSKYTNIIYQSIDQINSDVDNYFGSRHMNQIRRMEYNMFILYLSYFHHYDNVHLYLNSVKDLMINNNIQEVISLAKIISQSFWGFGIDPLGTKTALITGEYIVRNVNNINFISLRDNKGKKYHFLLSFLSHPWRFRTLHNYLYMIISKKIPSSDVLELTGYSKYKYHGQIILIINTLTNSAHIEKKFDGKRYVMQNTKTGNYFDFFKILEINELLPVLIYKSKLDPIYYIEFPNCLDSTYNSILMLKYNSETRTYYFHDHKIITGHLPAIIKQWSYGLPAFIIEINGSYQLLFFDMFGDKTYSNLIIKNLATNWSDQDKFSDVRKKLSNYTPTTILSENGIVLYYMVKISYNGLSLDFPSIQSFRSYLLLCILYQKTECINLLLKKYATILLTSHPEIDISKDIIGYMIYKNCGNTPFTHYYANILDTTFKCKLNSEYQERLKRNIYGPKYQFKKPEQKLYQIDKLRPIKKMDMNYQLDKAFNMIRINPIQAINPKELHGNVKLDLEKFIEKYRACGLDPREKNDLRFNALKQLGFTFREYKKSLIRISHHYYLNQTISLTEIILSRPDIFYNCLGYNIYYRVISDLTKLDFRGPCLELKKIHDLIDSNKLYKNGKNTEIILFEILTGYYIWKDSSLIYEDIVKTIDNNISNIPNQRSYKIHQLLMGKGKSSTILPLIMLKYYLSDQIMNTIITVPEHLKKGVMRVIIRYTQILSETYLNYLVQKRDKMIANETIKILANYDIKKILVLDDETLKAIKLNSELYHLDIPASVSNKTVLILDEFDTMYDPMKSDLNYPVNSEIFKYSKLINDKLIDQLIDFIIDNPTKMPDFSLRYANKLSIDNQDLLNIVDNKAIINNKDIIIPSNLFNVLRSCYDLVYQKDYGFPLKIKGEFTHDNPFYAIPYAAVDDPIPQSEFSSVDIVIILTILSYTYADIRTVDIMNFIKDTKMRTEQIKILDSTVNLNEIFQEELLLFNVNDISDITEISEIALNIIAENFIQKSKVDHDFTKKFKKKYLKETIIPQISYTKDQYNCSFLDVINQFVYKFKCGFSGTVSIDLPQFTDKELEFTTIEEIAEDKGAVYAAILGLYNVVLHPIHQLKLNNDVLKTLTDLILEFDYNVLIDSGAFLLGYDPLAVCRYIASTKHFDYLVYITKDNIIMVYQARYINDIHYLGEKYTEQTHELSRLFIYYDNKHIVGTDIKQPYNMSGLATIASFNTFTEIAQAIYRLRGLNFGHMVDFVTKSLPEIMNRTQLLKFLFINENKKFSTTHIKRLEQNIKCLNRLTNPDDNPYYEYVNNPYYYFKDVDFRGKTLSQLNRDLKINNLIYLVKNPDNLMLTLLNELSMLVYSEKEITGLHLDTSKQQQREVQIEQEKYELEIVYPMWKVFAKEVTIDDYFKPDKYRDKFLPEIAPVLAGHTIQFLISMNILAHNDIFYSPYFNYYAAYCININIPNDIKFLQLRYYNFYYIKIINPERYLLISPKEFYVFIRYFDNGHAFPVKFFIKDKWGNVKYPYNQIDSLTITPKELYVRLLLVGRLSIPEKFQVLNFMCEHSNWYSHLLFALYFTSQSNVPIYDQNLFDKFVDKEKWINYRLPIDMSSLTRDIDIQKTKLLDEVVKKIYHGQSENIPNDIMVSCDHILTYIKYLLDKSDNEIYQELTSSKLESKLKVGSFKNIIDNVYKSFIMKKGNKGGSYFRSMDTYIRHEELKNYHQGYIKYGTKKYFLS